MTQPWKMEINGGEKMVTQPWKMEINGGLTMGNIINGGVTIRKKTPLNMSIWQVVWGKV